MTNHSPHDFAKSLGGNYLSVFRCLEASPRVGFIEDERHVRFSSGCGTDWLNGVLSASFSPVRLPEAVDEVLGAVRRLGASALWRVGVLSANRELLASTLLEAGCRELTPEDAMIRTAESPPRIAESPLEIRVVRTERELVDWTIPLRDGYSLVDDSVALLVDAFSRQLTRPVRDLRHLVGYEQDRPVSCASLLLHNGIAGLYNIATVTNARGKGYGSAITARCVELGVLAGFDTAGLYATRAGDSIYRSLGFRSVDEQRYFVI